MGVKSDAAIEITAFDWVPDFAQGFVRDLRPRWACEEMGVDYAERLISAVNRPADHYRDQPWGQVPVLRDGMSACSKAARSCSISPNRTPRCCRATRKGAPR